VSPPARTASRAPGGGGSAQSRTSAGSSTLRQADGQARYPQHEGVETGEQGQAPSW